LFWGRKKNFFVHDSNAEGRLVGSKNEMKIEENLLRVNLLNKIEPLSTAFLRDFLSIQSFDMF
jgi:hypothetical protein